MQRLLPIAVLLLVILAGSAGAVGSAGQSVGPPGDDMPDDGPSSEEPAADACDYAALYAETVDAVVQVQVQVFDGAAEEPGSGGLGSGFVIDRDGGQYIVTNQHVVADEDTVTIEFSDGQTREGTVIGTDADSDLAIVSVSDLPASVGSLSFAEETPRPGERVAAFGSPLGLEGTITEGIVSAVDRSIPTPQGVLIPSAVQTDAPINPGNSGGPLVDCEGNVVGVNTAGAGQNLGFAVGTPLIDRVVPSLIETGDYDHASLGVQTVDLGPPLAAANDVDRTSGVYVDDTVSDSPAAGELQGTTAQATVSGVSVPVGGDVIVAVDGTEIRNGEELNRYLSVETAPGETVTLTVLRDGEETAVTVTLEGRSAGDGNLK